METEAKVIQKADEVEVTQKLEEIKLEIDENPEVSSKVTDQMKRSSLSKFFRFKKSASIENVSEPKIPKSNTLMRLFTKKSKDKEAGKEEFGPEEKNRSFIMRGLVNCQIVPWISRQTSQMNIHQPIQVPKNNDDDGTPQEIATSSEIF
jgi:hypothetical protein